MRARGSGGAVFELDERSPGQRGYDWLVERFATGELVLVDEDGQKIGDGSWPSPGPSSTPAAAPDITDGSINEVLAAVRGAKPGEEAAAGWQDRARAALAAEQAKGDEARSTLISRLESALDAEGS